jgi:hypothetical protein
MHGHMKLKFYNKTGQLLIMQFSLASCYSILLQEQDSLVYLRPSIIITSLCQAAAAT